VTSHISLTPHPHMQVREEFIEQGRAQLEAEGVENVNVMEVQNVMEQMQV
jgi:hypothetical protein